MARRSLAIISAFLAANLAASLLGCANDASSTSQALLVSPAKADGSTLSKAELAYDCSKLTGHMRIRISQMRATADRERTSLISRSMQQGVNVLGGSTQGADPAADLARDRQMLNAYNSQLVAKNCKPLDLEGELKGQPTRDGGKSLTSKSQATTPAAAAKPKP